MTRVAIIGIGFVGQLVQQALSEQGATTVLVHAPRVSGSLDATIGVIADVHAPEIRDLAAQLHGVDVVVNTAGMPDASAGGSATLFGANAVLPALVGLAARRAGARRFVHVSSAVVQGGRPVLDESWRTEEFSPYSASKAVGERLAVAAAPAITTVYRPPSVHAPDRRVTRTLARLARSPISCVAGRGDRPTPQALGVNVGGALAHLALTPSAPPRVVVHPWEGLTTGSLLRLLGDREPHHLPTAAAYALLWGARAVSRVVPASRANVRRLELIWFGQRQTTSWLTHDGWVPLTDEDCWRRLGWVADGGKWPAARAGHPTIIFGVTTGIVVKSFFTGQFEMLREHGWEVTVLATAENNAREVTIAEGAEFVELSAVRDTSPLRDLQTLIALVRELRRRRPDLAVWGTPKVGLLGTIASRLTGGRSVYVLHGLRLETTSGPRRLMLSITERIAARLADDVVAVGHDLRRQAEQLGLVRRGTVEVLGHGSANGVVAVPPAPGARGRLGLPTDTLVVGFVGRVTRDKGIVELLQAWPEVHRRTAAHLAIAGMQEPDASTEPIASLLDRSPGMHYLGHVNDLTDVYDALDLLVLPSHREGLSTVVLEASAYGIPCIVSDATGASESVDDGVTGMVVPVGDTRALQQALLDLCEDRHKRESMGRAAQLVVSSRYGRDVVHAQWLRYFEARRPMGKYSDA